MIQEKEMIKKTLFCESIETTNNRSINLNKK